MLNIVEKKKKQRSWDAELFKYHDQDLCMLCHAHGADKRSLFIRCFYELKEVSGLFLDLGDVNGFDGYYLRICKNCRGHLLGVLRQWADNMTRRRTVVKDHDGHNKTDNT